MIIIEATEVAGVNLFKIEVSEDEIDVYERCMRYMLGTTSSKQKEAFSGATEDEFLEMHKQLSLVLTQYTSLRQTDKDGSVIPDDSKSKSAEEMVFNSWHELRQKSALMMSCMEVLLNDDEYQISAIEKTRVLHILKDNIQILQYLTDEMGEWVSRNRPQAFGR